MRGRETFTRDEVKALIRQSTCEQLKAASGMLQHNGHRVPAEVLARMASKLRKDDDLLARTLDAAEDHLPAKLILDAVS